MDPLSIVASVITLISAASAIGSKLHKLYDRSCAATSEFEIFSNEVRTFGMLWQAVLPCLEDPQGVFSDELLRTLKRVRKDTSGCLRDIEASLQEFARQERAADRSDERRLFCTLFIFIDNQEQKENRRVERFLIRNNFTLLRSRLNYATKLLNVVLVVTKWAKISHSSCLFG